MSCGHKEEVMNMMGGTVTRETLFLYEASMIFWGINVCSFLLYFKGNLELWAYPIFTGFINTLSLVGNALYFSATKYNFQYDLYVLVLFILNIYIVFLYEAVGGKKFLRTRNTLLIIVLITIFLRILGITPLNGILISILDIFS
jgi:hypothetical protein